MTDNPNIITAILELNAQIAEIKRVRAAHSDQIAELQHSINRLTGWMRALDFDGRGVILQDDAPPILRLLATIQAQNEQIIIQNALLIGTPTLEEAAALKKAQQRSQVSLPALLLQLAEMAQSVRDLRRGQFGQAAGLVALLVLVILHSWQMAQSISAALVGGG